MVLPVTVRVDPIEITVMCPDCKVKLTGQLGVRMIPEGVEVFVVVPDSVHSIARFRIDELPVEKVGDLKPHAHLH